MCTHYFGGTKLQLIIKPTMLNALPIFSLFCPSLSCRSQCLENESCSVMSDSLQSHGPYSPQNSPGQNTAVGSLFLLQGIFPSQGSNPGLSRVWLCHTTDCSLPGPNETFYLRLGLEPMGLGFEPNQNPVWKLNLRDRDLKPAKTHISWFQGLIKLRFLMFHPRKNSVRDKVKDMKWIYSDSERNTRHRQSVGLRRGWVWLWNVVWLVFIGWVISYANEWEDYSNCFGEGMEISRIWATPHSLVFYQCLGSVMAPLDGSFHLWLRIKV